MPRRMLIAMMLTLAFASLAFVAESPQDPKAAPATKPEADAPLPAAETWIPREAVAVLKLNDAKAILDQLLRPALVDAVKASPVFQAAAANPGFQQAVNLVRTVEGRLESDWQTGLRRLFAGGATLAVGPDGSALLIVDAADAQVIQVLHEYLMFFARMQAAAQRQLERIKQKEVDGLMVYSVGPNEAHTLIGKRLVVANRPDVLKLALDMRGGAGGESVATKPAYREAMKAAGPGAAAALYADTAAIKQAPAIARALSTETNPLGALLAAPLLESLSRSTWLTLALKVAGNELALEAVSDGTIDAEGASRFAFPPEGAPGARPNLAVPRRIAAMTLYRDLYGFYGAKDDLFPERGSGIIFFENMMGIFFTGRNLTEEVFAELGPEIRLVVAEQEYDRDVGTPAVKYPAFALVAPLKNPGTYKRVLEEAWQKAVGLVNFTRGQQAEPGLVIDRPVHAGTKFTVAGFNPIEGEDKSAVDARFNFEPSLAMPGKWMILSSTGGLARDLMDALAREGDTAAGAPSRGTHSLLEIDGPQLASILESNREALIRNNMIEEGNTRPEAEVGINLMLTAARYVQRVVVTLGAESGRSTASLKIRFGKSTVQSGGK